MLKKILILLLIINLYGCSQPDGYDSNHNAINFNDYRGKWLIVNYWASWCKPCLIEMPTLNAFYKSHKDSVMVLGVNFDGTDDQELNQIAKQHQIQYPLISTLNNAQLEEQDFSVLPVSFVFNPQGKLVQTLRGPQTAHNLQQLISKPKA
ncbi:MAG TPA: TlpA disulfide reductase family protein [Coxiellaceae bacterium]|nr:TlpA disulfide reductase family protein [Coxiellaceae bacterium]